MAIFFFPAKCCVFHNVMLGVVKCDQYPLLPKLHPHLPMAQPALTNEATGTESQQHNCSIIH